MVRFFRALVLALLVAGPIGPAVTAAEPQRPNVVIIFIDDMGYADIGPFGATEYATPNLDQMAQEGMRFTNFAVSAAVCSASRAALMTGCYHVRVGVFGALGPDANVGLNPNETTLGELCKSQGYATACFGKWHLGHHPKFLPTANGFDEYYGLPYSNDMWPNHPANVARLKQNPDAKPIYPPLPLLEGDRVIDAEVTAEDQARLTRQYTERAVRFIDRNAEEPFFLYLPHSMVHVPLYASEEFRGKSGAGLYGDVVMEIDWSVGQVLRALKRNGIDDRTLVIFTSDNGPWLSYGEHAGSAGPLREGKGTMFEGGYREPTVMRWPGKIPAESECDELASTIDILPTVAAMIGATLPDHPIDGHDIRPLMFGDPDARSPHEAFYCYFDGGQLQAVRDSRWKLHFPHEYRTLGGRPGGRDGQPVPYETASIGRVLYDLENDIGETTDVAAEHPEVVERLEKAADQARAQLGDRMSERTGEQVRPIGRMMEGDQRLRW